ncbi:MAG: hypothetical protein ACRDOX_02150 [Nocardioides sp.]
MRWYVRHFYDVGVGAAIIALAWGVLADLNTLQQILLLSFAVLCLHEFEEYGWPGGFPSYMSRVMFPKISARLGKDGGHPTATSSTSSTRPGSMLSRPTRSMSCRASFPT